MTKGKTDSQSRTLAEFMQQMGSKNGFDPMPPSQHAYLLDVEQPAQNRAISWVWSKTIHPDKRRKHHLHAHDERGDLTLKHAASDLGWHLSNTIRTFGDLEDKGRIRRDEKGRIYLEGDAPEPRRILGEDVHQKQDAENEGHICTDMCDPAMYLFFQQLKKLDFDRCSRDYKSVKEYRKRIEAEAIAAAREIGQKIEDNWRKAVGAPLPERKGRPRQDRPQTAVQLSLLEVPELSVQIGKPDTSPNSVQNDLSPSVQNEKRTVQIAASLLNKTETLDKTFSAPHPDLELSGRGAAAASPAGNSPPPPLASNLSGTPNEQDDVRSAIRAESIKPDTTLVRQIIEKSRSYDRRVTVDDICQAIHQKGSEARKAVNPSGFLFRVIPKLFENGIDAFRDDESAPTSEMQLSYLDRILQDEE